MADDSLSAALEEIRERADAATPGPWGTEEDADCWQLFGALDTGLHPLQLIKAPKRGASHAEYWPRDADTEFIVAARSDVPWLLAIADKVLKLHGSVPYYAGADGCDHPEPPEEADEWEDWADGHPVGTGGDRICLTEHILDFCPECTRVAYGDEEPVNEDCVRAPCGTREAITRELTGRE